MNHNDIRHKLSEYLDNAVSSSEKAEIEKHLESCAECSAALTELRKAIEHVKAVEEMESPAWMTQKIMARVREEADRKKSIWHRLFFPLRLKLPIQAVAVAFLTVTAFYMYQHMSPEMKLARAPIEGFDAKPETPNVAMNEPAAQAQKPAPAPETKAPSPVVARSEALKQSRKYTMESESQADKLAAAPAAPAPMEERVMKERGDVAAKREREEAQPFAGLVARDEAPSKAPAPAAKTKAMSFADMKDAGIHFTVKVKDIDAASKEVEQAVARLAGKVIEAELLENKKVITVAVGTDKTIALFEKLKLIGEVEEKTAPSAGYEGNVVVVVVLSNVQ